MRGNEAHFRGELHALLAQVQEILAELAIEEYDGLASNDAIFRSAERKNVHAQIARCMAQILAERSRGVRDAGAVHMQEHVPLMRELPQGPNFLRTVNSAHLSGLRDGDHPDLHVVLIANTVIGVAHVMQCDFAVVMRQRDQLATRMLFRRAAFVGINVRILAAEHGVVRTSQRLKSENIGAGSVECEENINV